MDVCKSYSGWVDHWDRKVVKALATLVLPWIVVGVLAVTNLNEYLRNITPATYWMRVDSVVVADAMQGDPVIMHVSRTVYRPFSGEWLATVRRIDVDGPVAACFSSGRNHYTTDAKLPNPLTLDWWTHPIKCNLPEGRYRLDTIWTISVEGYPQKTLSIASNVFEVHKR